MPPFLAPVEPSPVTLGEDMHAVAYRRTAELETVNSRVERSVAYMKANCAGSKK